MLATLLLLSVIGGVLSTVGGVALLAWRNVTERLLIHLATFAAGALLGAAFLDLMPEAVKLFEEAGVGAGAVGVASLVGIVAFFLLERLLLRFHGHGEQESHITKTPWLLVIGDSLHNFADGIAIAAALFVNPSLGLVTALAVAAHEVPSEIGEFSVMLQAGWQRKTVFFWNVVSAFMTTVGAIVAYLGRDVITPLTPWVIAGTMGVFVYIAASDLIPEIHVKTRRDSAGHVIGLLLLGIVVVGTIGRLVD